MSMTLHLVYIHTQVVLLAYYEKEEAWKTVLKTSSFTPSPRGTHGSVIELGSSLTVERPLARRKNGGCSGRDEAALSYLIDRRNIEKCTIILN